jgi:Domain of unknown function (DUF6398)
MPKRSISLHVPKDMQARFEEITQLPDAFCHTYLNEEYAQLSRELTATLCRKRPSPLERGKVIVWACGIIHALGMVNFLFDSSQTPHIAASQIWEYFELSSSRHAGQIQADPRSVGHVSHGSGVVDALNGGPASTGLDAGGQWADHRCAPCPT